MRYVIACVIVICLASLAWAATWEKVEPTEENAIKCAANGEKAQLVTIYDWQFVFVEARCYPQGGVN